MTDTIGTTGSTRLSSRACDHPHCEGHVACVGAGPLREHRGPPDRIRSDGGTCENRTAEVRRAVRNPDLGEMPAGPAVRDRDRAAKASRRTGRPVRDAENEERRQVTVTPHEPVPHEPTTHAPSPHEPVPHESTPHEPTRQEVTGLESRLAAAERKAADQTTLATRALSLRQKEWRRAEALAANNQRLQDACHALRRELDIAREEATTARIRTCRLDYQLSTLREQYVIELRRLHQEAVEQARTLRTELTAAAKEVDDLRVTLSRAREHAQITGRQTEVTNGWAEVTNGRARIMGERARITDERAQAVRGHAAIAREQFPIPHGWPGGATSPAGGRHRRRAPNHRSNRLRFGSGPRSDRLSWMRSRSAGVSCPMLTSIVTWLIRLR